MKKLLLIALLLPCMVVAQDKKPVAHCKGVKTDGTPCKSVIVDKKTGYCGAHDPATLRCGYIKKDGKPCRMTVKKEGTRCRFHEGK